MKAYIAKRILVSIPLLFGISFIAFVLVNLIPVDPAEVILRISDVYPTEEAVTEMREQLGLNDPFLVRYGKWLSKSLRFDFGATFTNNNRTVAGEIARSLPATLELAGAALAIVVVVSLAAGISCALWRNSLFDRAMRLLVFVGTAMPNYWVGLLLMWLFALKLDVLPTSGTGGMKHLILPAVTLSLTYISTYIRLIRNNMIENMNEEYVLYADARGLRRKTVIFGHVLRNSLHTCVTALGMSVPQLIAGTVVIENIFAWPGIGRLCISAIFNRDYPVIQAYILIMGVLFIFRNLAVDILHCLMEPRLRRAG